MWCALAQITINKGQGILAQITRNNFFYEKTRTKIWCVLAQIIKNNFFLWKDKDKNVACAGTNNKNKGQDVEMNIDSYYKLYSNNVMPVILMR